MNQGRIWCVVSPTVGLPLFLGSVAVTSLIVHYSVLSNTTWFSSFLNGGAKAKVASVESTVQPVSLNSTASANGVTISMAPVSTTNANGETSYVITLAPKLATVAQADAPAEAQTLAMAAPSAR